MLREALRADAGPRVPEVARSDRRVVRDLLAEEAGFAYLSAVVMSRPVFEEYLAEEGVEGLFKGRGGGTSAIVLGVEGGEEGF